MERTYLQWNAVNWITVVMMVVPLVVIVALAARIASNISGRTEND